MAATKQIKNVTSREPGTLITYNAQNLIEAIAYHFVLDLLAIRIGWDKKYITAIKDWKIKIKKEDFIEAPVDRLLDEVEAAANDVTDCLESFLNSNYSYGTYQVELFGGAVNLIAMKKKLNEKQKKRLTRKFKYSPVYFINEPVGPDDLHLIIVAEYRGGVGLLIDVLNTIEKI